MTVRYLLAAIAAGLLAGILMTPVQYRQVVPIIVHAEEFEGAAQAGATAHAADHQPAAQAAPAASGHVHAHGGTTDGGDSPLLLGRFWNTVLANLVTGAGFALLMTGVSLISGVAIRFSTGLAWGAAGWLAVQFLPGLGLPPELPGFPYVDLQARQFWWTAAVGASISGMALLFLRKENIARAAGIVLLLGPHLYGAPQPADMASEVPAFLAAEFVMAALSTTLFFWLALGLLLGFFMDRSGKAA
jgi:cobalt transporter subunit CbtA